MSLCNPSTSTSTSSRSRFQGLIRNLNIYSADQHIWHNRHCSSVPAWWAGCSYLSIKLFNSHDGHFVGRRKATPEWRLRRWGDRQQLYMLALQKAEVPWNDKCQRVVASTWSYFWFDRRNVGCLYTWYIIIQEAETEQTELSSDTQTCTGHTQAWWSVLTPTLWNWTKTSHCVLLIVKCHGNAIQCCTYTALCLCVCRHISHCLLVSECKQTEMWTHTHIHRRTHLHPSASFFTRTFIDSTNHTLIPNPSSLC